MSFRQLTSEEERLEEGVWALWEAFLFHWQDAMEFVNIQTPLITQNLEDNYQVGHNTCMQGIVDTPSVVTCVHIAICNLSMINKNRVLQGYITCRWYIYTEYYWGIYNTLMVNECRVLQKYIPVND